MKDDTLEIAQRNAKSYEYYRDGFAVSDRPLVDPDTIAKLRDHCVRVLNGQYETGRPPRSNTGGPEIEKHPPYIEASYPQDSDKTIAEFLRYPTLGPWVAKQTNATRVQINYLLATKKYPTADRKTRVGWHQDRRYLDAFFRSGSSANLWIALDEVSLDCGPISFVRGSHLWNKAYSSSFFDHDVDKEDFEIPEGKEWEVVRAALPAGWATLHGPATIHGSERCIGSRPRLGIVITVGLSSPGHNLNIDPNHYWGSRVNDTVACPVIYESDSEYPPAPAASYQYDLLSTVGAAT